MSSPSILDARSSPSKISPSLPLHKRLLPPSQTHTALPSKISPSLPLHTRLLLPSQTHATPSLHLRRMQHTSSPPSPCNSLCPTVQPPPSPLSTPSSLPPCHLHPLRTTLFISLSLRHLLPSLLQPLYLRFSPRPRNSLRPIEHHPPPSLILPLFLSILTSPYLSFHLHFSPPPATLSAPLRTTLFISLSLRHVILSLVHPLYFHFSLPPCNSLHPTAHHPPPSLLLPLFLSVPASPYLSFHLCFSPSPCISLPLSPLIRCFVHFRKIIESHRNQRSNSSCFTKGPVTVLAILNKNLFMICMY